MTSKHEQFLNTKNNICRHLNTKCQIKPNNLMQKTWHDTQHDKMTFKHKQQLDMKRKLTQNNI